MDRLAGNPAGGRLRPGLVAPAPGRYARDMKARRPPLDFTHAPAHWIADAPGYAYQLDAFAGAVLRGEPVKTPPQDAVENMTVIDAIYRETGFDPGRM